MSTIAAGTRSFALLAPLVLALACSAGDEGSGGSAGAASNAAGRGGAPSMAGAASQVGGQAMAGQSSSAGQAGTSAGGGGAPTGAGGAAGSASSSGGSGGRSAGGAGGSNTAGTANGGTSSGGTSSGGSTSAGPIKIWMAGDSTVQECSGTCPCGWGSRFDASFDDRVTVVNRAVGGRSIQTWLYEAAVTSTLGGDGECTLSSQTYDKRWRDMLDASSGMKPGDYLFIQFGINDGDSACPRHVGASAFKTSYGMLAQAAKDHGAQPVFITPVSQIACSGSNVSKGTREPYVTATKEAGTQFSVPVIDLNLLSTTLYQSLGFCPIPGGSDVSASTTGAVGMFFCDDHTHFDTSGAVQIAGLVAQAVRDQKLGLAAYLK